MSTRFLLDTNTVSYILSGKSPAARMALAGLKADESACVSVITEAELRFGIAKRPEATARIAAVEGFLRKMTVLPWGREEAASYGRVRAYLESKGEMLSSLDLLIAAHALAADAVLVTHDGAFRKLRHPGSEQHLELVDWATDLPRPALRI